MFGFHVYVWHLIAFASALASFCGKAQCDEHKMINAAGGRGRCRAWYLMPDFWISIEM